MGERSRSCSPTEEAERLGHELADARVPLGATLVFEIYAPRILRERLEQRQGGRIADLDERLDRRRDGVGIAVREEAREQLRHAGLRHFGQEVRELGERRVALGEARERPLDAERDILEAIEGQARQGLAGGAARLGFFAPEDVDQQIDHARATELAQELGEALEAKGRLVVVVERERLAARLLEHGQEANGVLLAELTEIVVRVARRARGVEEGPESDDRIET